MKLRCPFYTRIVSEKNNPIGRLASAPLFSVLLFIESVCIADLFCSCGAFIFNHPPWNLTDAASSGFSALPRMDSFFSRSVRLSTLSVSNCRPGKVFFLNHLNMFCRYNSVELKALFLWCLLTLAWCVELVLLSGWSSVETPPEAVPVAERGYLKSPRLSASDRRAAASSLLSETAAETSVFLVWCFSSVVCWC